MRIWRRRSIHVANGSMGMHVSTPARATGSYVVRRMSGYFECGCEVDRELLAAMIIVASEKGEAFNPATDVACPVHDKFIRYIETESGEMTNVTVEQED